MVNDVTNCRKRSSAQIDTRIQEIIRNVENWKKTADCSSEDSGLKRSVDDIQAEVESLIADIFDVAAAERETGRRFLKTIFGHLLVVTKQPPHLLTYKTEYTATVRLLLGPKILKYFQPNGDTKFPLTVQSFCISNNGETQTDGSPSPTASIVSLCTTEFEHTNDMSTATVRFRITPKMIRTQPELGDPYIAFDSCQIYFSVVLPTCVIGDGLLEAFTSTTALKVAPAGDSFAALQNSTIWPIPMEALIWRTAAGNLDELKIRSDELPFETVNAVIQAKFMEFTGRTLSPADVNSIQQKFFTAHYLKQAKKDKNIPLTYDDFMKVIVVQENERQKMTITYWGWFYYLAKFILTHLEFQDSDKTNTEKTSFWKEGLVHGYMTSKKVGDMLQGAPAHTFLLRFSNSIPNAVTLDWKETDGVYSYRGSATDLRLRNIVDRILETDRWKYFHSGKEKKSVLSRFVTESLSSLPPVQSRENCYIMARLRSHLDFPEE